MAESNTARTWAIQAQGLAKSFNNRFALRGIDLEVGQGESVVIFGPNGAGKTTLVKLLATIMTPSSGRILIDGLDIRANAEEVRRRIGVITHQTFLYNNLTAYENLEFYSRVYDVPRYRERIQEVVARLGMTSRLHDRVGTLSRGMQQRLSVVRSLLHKPTIMLLDEPETGLDQEAVPMAWTALRAEDGTARTVVLTTHSLERGLELGDRLLIIDRGRIVYQSSKRTLDLAGLRQVYQDSTRAAA